LSQCIFHEIQFMMDEIFCKSRSGGAKFLKMAPIRKAFNRLMENASSVPFVGYGVREAGSSTDTPANEITIVDVINIICLCDLDLMKTFFSMRACNIHIEHRMGGIGPNRLLRLQEFFYEVDKDGSGTITQDELKYHITHDPKMAALLDFPSTKPTKKQLAELFKKLDSSESPDDEDGGGGGGGKDGVIDFIEFATFFSAMPAMQFWAVMESETPSPSRAKSGRLNPGGGESPRR